MQELDTKFKELLQRLCKINGFDDLTSKIVSILFIEPEEVAMEDLAKQTGYSLASISNKVNMLAPTGFIAKKHKPGSKKVYLYMEKDFFRILKSHLMKTKTKLNIAKESLPPILDEYKSKAKTAGQKKKLEIIKNYSKAVSDFDRIMNHILKNCDKVKNLK